MRKPSGLLFAFSGNHYTSLLCTSSPHLYQPGLGPVEGRALSSVQQEGDGGELEATAFWLFNNSAGDDAGVQLVMAR